VSELELCCRVVGVLNSFTSYDDRRTTPVYEFRSIRSRTYLVNQLKIKLGTSALVLNSTSQKQLLVLCRLLAGHSAFVYKCSDTTEIARLCRVLARRPKKSVE